MTQPIEQPRHGTRRGTESHPPRTVDLSTGETAPMASDSPDAAVTVPFGGGSRPFPAEGAPTMDLGGAPTADLGYAPPVVPDAAAFSGRSAAPTAAFGLGAAVTVPLASPTAMIVGAPPAATVTLPLRQTEPVPSRFVGNEPQTGELGLAGLRQKVAIDPSDVDALFRLAVQLHRQGNTDEARTTLSRLAAVYQERGQPAQAARIFQMLGMAPVEAAPPAPVVPVAPPTSALPPTPQSVTARLRQTGRIALGDTLPLRGTGPVGTSGLGQEAPVTQAPFPPEALAFTVPLPGEEALDEELRATVQESAANLASGRLEAALDACIYGLALDDTYLPLSVRIAEIFTAQRHLRRARVHAETLLRLMEAAGAGELRWMGYRILLHTAERDLDSLRSLVQLLIDAGQTELASFYASRLIRLLDGEGLAEEALGYSVRLCDLIPGDTRAALENAVLRLKGADPGGAVDRWETAVAAGADPIMARASLAAVMTTITPDDHWRMLAQVLPVVREQRDAEIVDAYAHTAEVMAPSPTLAAGRGLLLAAVNDPTAAEVLAKVAGDRTAPPLARASSALTLAALAAEAKQDGEHVAAIRTALQLLDDPSVAGFSGWLGLIGAVPRAEDLGLQLGRVLLDAQDAVGAVEALKAAHERSPHHDEVCNLLADAYFRSGQLGNALTVLDGLAAHHRSKAHLEPMAAVLRKMSQMAPNNIKVKSRLIDTYLQRGFVAEARAELIQRAELEERSGLIKDALASLQRAADLAWTLGMADETFALYRRMINLAPDVVDNRHALVALYLQVGRLAEAAEHQRAIVDISLREERKHEAIAALHQVIGLTPDDTSAYYQLGELLSSAGEYRQAERVYRRILAITPDDDIALAKANAMADLGEQRVG